MAVPALPILASALWTQDHAEVQNKGTDTARRVDKLHSGCAGIDKTLNQGLEYGSINCISGDPDSGRRELCEAFLVSHLLSSSNATAELIDTALAFNVRRLHDILVNRLSDEGDPSKAAVEILERVKIMKVFDFVGLTESISELRDTLADGSRSSQAKNVQQPPPPTGTIGDSDDEEEMLDWAPTPPNSSPSRKQYATQDSALPKRLLIVDNISQVAGPLIKNHHSQGQALLMNFMRSLAHLTKTYEMCTVLVNSVISNPISKDEGPSIFSSCTLRPSLGKAFTHTLDTQFLVQELTGMALGLRASAVELTLQNGLPSRRSFPLIIEVLQSRRGGLAGQWTAFTVDGLGELQDSS